MISPLFSPRNPERRAQPFPVPWQRRSAPPEAKPPQAESLPSDRSCQMMQRELGSRLNYVLWRVEELTAIFYGFSSETRRKYFASLQNLKLARDLTVSDFEQLRRTRGEPWRDRYHHLDAAVEELRQRCNTAFRRLGEDTAANQA